MSFPEYIGIDPGQSGGLASLSAGGDCNHERKMPPTLGDMWSWFAHVREGSRAVIELVHAMPKQGVSSTFKFGRNYGVLLGCLTAAGIPFEEITPRTWQKGLNIPPRKKSETPTQWKNRLKEKAQQLFPSCKVTLATADALLIAEYCRRKHQGLLRGQL